MFKRLLNAKARPPADAPSATQPKAKRRREVSAGADELTIYEATVFQRYHPSDLRDLRPDTYVLVDRGNATTWFGNVQFWTLRAEDWPDGKVTLVDPQYLKPVR